MLDSLKLYGSELRALLPDGETPLVAVSCTVAFGADRLERSRQDREHLLRFLPRKGEAVELLSTEAPRREEKAGEKALDRVLDALSGDLIKGDPDQWIGGTSATGHVGSTAYRVSKALGGHDAECMVTDRRVVFAGQRGSAFEELLSFPRQAVVAARRRGRILQRGRVVLDFVDRSQIALSTGILFTGQARRLVSALSGGVTPEG